MLYFAYGSNMDWDEMHACCPSARFSFTARLDGYKLAFTHRNERRKCAVADVLSGPGCCVWGIIYDIGAPRDNRFPESKRRLLPRQGEERVCTVIGDGPATWRGKTVERGDVYRLLQKNSELKTKYSIPSASRKGSRTLAIAW
jgi:hypothetical protein